MTDTQQYDLTHKKGTDFKFTGPGPLATGTWTARSQIRTSTGKLLATLDCTLTPDNSLPDGDTHVLVLESSDDTSTWPVGVYLLDVKFYCDNGNKIASQTATLFVCDRVTADV